MNKINKVVSMKISFPNKEIAEKFESHYRTAFTVTRHLFNEISCWGNDTVDSKIINDKGVKIVIPVDLVKKRKELYDLTDKSITFEQFSLILKVLYIALINVKSRGLTSSILGSPTKVKDFLQNSDWDTINSLLGKWQEGGMEIVYKISNSLTKMGFKNRYPYNIPVSSRERYGIIGNISRMLTAWEENNKQCSDNYLSETRDITEEISKVDTDKAKTINEFFSYCISNNIISHFDPRIHAYLRDCVIPGLKEGKTELENHFYKDKDKKITFSLHENFYNYLRDCPTLWNQDKPFILDHIYILEMIMNHNSHRPTAFYPFIGETDLHRFQYLLGDNYIPYDFNATGDEVENTEITISDKFNKTTYQFVKGVKIKDLFVSFNRGNTDKKTMTFRIHTKDKYHSGKYNPNSYFKDLSVWTVNTKQCINLFQFTRKTQTVRAIIKEPSIVFTDGYYAIRLNMTVVTNDDIELTNDLLWYLTSSLPASVTKRDKITDTPKNMDRFDRIKEKEFKFLGVDLGQRNPFSWAVGKSTIVGCINDVTILDTGIYRTDPHDEYWQLYCDIRGFRKIIGITKNINDDSNSNFDHLFIKNLLQRAKTYFSTYTRGNEIKQKRYREFVEKTDIFKSTKDLLRDCDNNLENIKKNPEFIGTILLKYINLRFKEIKVKRMFHLKESSVLTKLNQEFTWLKIIDQRKRILRSVSYLGTDNDRTPIQLVNDTDYFNGCKDNFLKVIASSLVKIAVDHKCHIIVMERLNKNATRTSLNKRNENFLNSLWSTQRIKDAIQNAANWHGILIGEASESQTSQVHYESGSYGHREKESLYFYNNKGILCQTHADINAAKNIIKKFVTRHAYTTQLSKQDIMIEKTEKDTEHKTIKGFLTHEFGSLESAYKICNPLLKTTDYIYKHKGSWITKESLMEMREKIKQELKQKTEGERQK